MKCPKDGATMEEKNVSGVMLDFCTKCGGVWMDWGELSRVSGNKATEHELILRGESKLICPRCNKKMKAANIHSVAVDECGCGMFFDVGEADKIVGKNLLLETEGVTVKVTRDDLKKLLDDGRIKIGSTELILVR